MNTIYKTNDREAAKRFCAKRGYARFITFGRGHGVEQIVYDPRRHAPVEGGKVNGAVADSMYARAVQLPDDVEVNNA